MDMPFAEDTFEAVKPGSRLAITGIGHSAGYLKVLTSLGLADIKRSGPNLILCSDPHRNRPKALTLLPWCTL